MLRKKKFPGLLSKRRGIPYRLLDTGGRIGVIFAQARVDRYFSFSSPLSPSPSSVIPLHRIFTLTCTLLPKDLALRSCVWDNQSCTRLWCEGRPLKPVGLSNIPKDFILSPRSR